MDKHSRQSGFASPAGDQLSKHLDLNELIVKHPSATFFMRFKGSPKYNVLPNDLLVIDRSIKPHANQLVIAISENEFILSKFTNATSTVWGAITSIIRHV